MTDSSDDTNGDGSLGSPEEAFSILGDETRLQILLELAEVVNEHGPGTPLSFSELRTRVGVEDSGRFNYHLDKLREGFIAKTDEGYIALFPALEVVSAIYAGTYGSETEEHTVESDWECPECDRTLMLQFHQAQLHLRCEEHGIILGYPTPPGAYEGRTLPELASVTYLRAMTEIHVASEGVCPRCWGKTTASYPVESESGDVLWGEEIVGTRLVCDRCWLRYTIPLRTLVASTPAVRALLDEYDLDPLKVTMTDASAESSLDWDVTLHQERPVRATVELTLGEEEMVFELDEDGRTLNSTTE